MEFYPDSARMSTFMIEPLLLVLIRKPKFSDERGQPSAISFQQKIFNFLSPTPFSR
jgi:hypothetical protein